MAILAIIFAVHDDNVFVDIIAVHRRHLSSLLPSSSPPPCPRFLLPPLAKLQVDFNRQFIDDISNDCLMSVNGTNFRIPQKGQAKKGNPFGSHKYAGKSALCYELSVDIWGGESCLDSRSVPRRQVAGH